MIKIKYQNQEVVFTSFASLLYWAKCDETKTDNPSFLLMIESSRDYLKKQIQSYVRKFLEV